MKMWAGLFVGYRGSLALGRVAFIFIFCLCVYFWLARPIADFPPTLWESMVAVLIYNFGGKAANTWKETKSHVQNGS